MIENNNPRIIIALDYPDEKSALQMLDQLSPELCRIKIGKELFVSTGPKFVEKVSKMGFDVFLDLKFHDIPNTVAKACKAAANLGIWMLNVHASGGLEMMQAAKNSLADISNKPLLIAVTILTSLDNKALLDIGYKREVLEQVIHLAKLTQFAGLDGVVCSAHEAKNIKSICGNEFNLITPGVRPVGSQINDQSRIMTPQQALDAGSNYLVIGRPITAAKNPLKALEKISQEIS